MNTFNMTCEAVEATLPDYLDETLEAWVRSSVEEHLGQCLRCAGLVRDLRNIEREAAALPDLVPVRDLWPGIESRIGTPVVTFAPVAVKQTDVAATVAANTRPNVNTRVPGRRVVPMWMGAAAAALVVLTAGTTYLLTSWSLRPAAPANVASARATTNPPLVADSGLGDESSSAATDPSGSDSSESVAGEPRRRTPVSGRKPSASLAGRSAIEAVYVKEIVMLQAIMSWRKAELDPATAAIIDKNLKIIDAAIAQSKAALRRDPASFMLSDQLTHALDKKVELLRTAAMLPASS